MSASTNTELWSVRAKVTFKGQDWRLSYEAPKLHISSLIPSTDLVVFIMKVKDGL